MSETERILLWFLVGWVVGEAMRAIWAGLGPSPGGRAWHGGRRGASAATSTPEAERKLPQGGSVVGCQWKPRDCHGSVQDLVDEHARRVPVKPTPPPGRIVREGQEHKQ